MLLEAQHLVPLPGDEKWLVQQRTGAEDKGGARPRLGVGSTPATKQLNTSLWDVWGRQGPHSQQLSLSQAKFFFHPFVAHIGNPGKSSPGPRSAAAVTATAEA
eukprot:355059-Chlamydomonas_euryale.AAC.4